MSKPQTKKVIEDKEKIISHLKTIFPTTSGDALKRIASSIKRISFVSNLDFGSSFKQKKNDVTTIHDGNIIEDQSQMEKVIYEEKKQ